MTPIGILAFDVLPIVLSIQAHSGTLPKERRRGVYVIYGGNEKT